ncbi:MAG: hypothetical protein EAZ85_12570 [Bacteroidetes bacterium]|nr:MAG: hypothetical protein EAZ85_12570 [Bacteroidota bacterium]
MNNEEYQEIRNKIQKAAAIWKNEGHLQKNLINEKSYKTTTLSKIINNSEKVGDDMIINVLEFVEQKIQEIGYIYDNNFETYIADNNNIKIKSKDKRTGLFSKISGVYEMFHLTAEGGIILKNTLQIYPDSSVIIIAKEGHTYYGQAHNFLNNLVSININKANDYDFYHQIIFDIGNYLMYGGEQVQRIFAISTTINLENMPMANARVLIRVPQNVSSQPFQYIPHTPEWHELNIQYPNLISYLTEQNTLKLKKRVNDLL